MTAVPRHGGCRSWTLQFGPELLIAWLRLASIPTTRAVSVTKLFAIQTSTWIKWRRTMATLCCHISSGAVKSSREKPRQAPWLVGFLWFVVHGPVAMAFVACHQKTHDDLCLSRRFLLFLRALDVHHRQYISLFFSRTYSFFLDSSC